MEGLSGTITIDERFRDLAEIGKQALGAKSDAQSTAEAEGIFWGLVARYGTLKVDPYAPEGAQKIQEDPVDWREVQRVGVPLAAAKFHLKVYNYLCLAVFHNHPDAPYEALTALLTSYRDRVEGAWDRCEPTRAPQREQQEVFLSDALKVAMVARPPQPQERAAFESCAAAIGALSAALRVALKPVPDRETLTQLRGQVEVHRQALTPAPLPPVVQTAAAAPATERKLEPGKTEGAAAPLSGTEQKPGPEVSKITAPPAAALVPAPAAVPASGGKTREQLEGEVWAGVMALGNVLRESDLKDPASYWMTRALLWANHALLTPESYQEIADKGGQSQVPRPGQHREFSEEIEKTISAGRHAEALKECEEQFGRYPLWLDLQAWSAACLEALGASAARLTLRHEVALLLGRCPKLKDFVFSDADRTPFASPETRRWLGREALGPAPALGPLPLPPVEARPRRAEGPAAAASVTPAAVAAVPPMRFGRGRFVERLQLAEHCLERGRADVAAALLAELLAEGDRHHLGDWEPELFAKAVRLRLASARIRKEETAERVRLFDRLCVLDPASAVEMEREPDAQ